MSGLRPLLRPLLVIALASMGCTGTDPSATPVVEAGLPAPLEEPPKISQRQLDHVIALRTRYGLRTDPMWVRAVAADPEARAAIDEYGIPLAPEEFADLRNRRSDPDLHRQVTAYGLRFPDDFAGASASIEVGGVIVRFKNDVEGHRAALSNLVPPGSVLVVRQVEYSLAELEVFAEQVEADAAWFASIGVTVRVGENPPDNVVDARFEGPEAAAGLIEQHYGNPTWLRARWVGPPPWEGPPADLTIEVVDTDGRPVQGLRVFFEPVDPMVELGGETVYGTGPGGVCLLENLPVALYRVGLYESVEYDYDFPEPLKEFQVDLAPDGTTIRVVVPAS